MQRTSFIPGGNCLALLQLFFRKARKHTEEEKGQETYQHNYKNTSTSVSVDDGDDDYHQVTEPLLLLFFLPPESRGGDGRQSVAGSEGTGGVASKDTRHV